MTRNETLLSLAVNSWINGNRVVWLGANLSYANLTRANLSYANLTGAYLAGARITLSNLTFTLTEETAR